jgi:hypothetical protein
MDYSRQRQIEWCRSQQIAAQEHRQPGHACSHPQCTPRNVIQWLEDTFAEELMIENRREIDRDTSKAAG